MDLRIQLTFVDDSNAPEIKKVYVKEENRIIIKRTTIDDPSVTENIDINLVGILAGDDFTPGYQNSVSSIRARDGITRVYLVSKKPEGEDEDVVTQLETISDFSDITYLYVATGETEVEETSNLEEPDYLPKNRSYEEKQERAIDAIENVWRKQKQEWLGESVQFADVNPEIPKHLGYWFKAVDKALITEFQNPDTDPAVVEAMARQAAEGPTDIETTQDFAVYLNKEGIDNHNEGPGQELLWVSRGDGQDATQIQALDIESSFRYAGQDPPPELPEDYDPTDTSFLVANQLGIATIVNSAGEPYTGPVATNTVLHISVLDPDSVKSGTETYQWQTLDTTIDAWTNINSATAETYTITQATGTIIRVTVTYEDNFGPDQEVESGPIVVA